VDRRRDIDQLHDEIQELFADMWQLSRFTGLRQGYRPPVDCYRTADPPELHVVVELPGIDPADVQVVLDERTLVIAGERKRPRREGVQYRQMELDYGTFQRQVRLDDSVDVDRATATYERGMLRLVLPIAPVPPPRAPVAIEVTRE
jgi:HSP20 family protein